MNSTDYSINIYSNNTTVYFDNISVNDQHVEGNLRIYQLNVEGISERKYEYLAKELLELKFDVVAVQETHLKEEGKRSFIAGYTMVSSMHHEKFGLATYVKNDLLPSVQVLSSENEYYTPTIS